MSHSLTHFVDLRLQPDPEFPVEQLMNALCAKLHRALHDQYSGQPGAVAVSFPQQRGADRSLGDTLRLHGDEGALRALMARSWLAGMSGHVNSAEIARAPTAPQSHREVRRVDVQGSADKLRRRWLRRHPGASADEARQHYPDTSAQRSALPFLQLQSRSTGQRYRIYVEQRVAPPQPGQYSTFGLSCSGSTVPWF